MKTFLIPLAALASLALSGQTMAAEHEVKMLNTGADGMMVFEPGYLKVAPGDTVTFLPSEPAHNSVSHFLPAGAASWKGAMNKPVTVKFEQEGVYLYKCEPHVPMGMVGVIQVGAANNLADARQAADTFKSSFAMNKDRLDKYLGQVK